MEHIMENSITINGVIFIPVKTSFSDNNCFKCDAMDICSKDSIPCQFFGGLLNHLVILKKAKLD